MALTRDRIIRDSTDNYLKTIDRNNPPKSSVIEFEILKEIESCIQAENNVRAGLGLPKWKSLDKLLPSQIADIVLQLYHVRSVDCSGVSKSREYDLLCIYQDTGKNEGIYISDETELKTIFDRYRYDISDKELEEIIRKLKRKAKRTTRCENRDLIAVNNGIFDYKNKQLLPFTPDEVFLSKSHIDYIPNVQNPVLHNNDDNTDWDIESWLNDLFDGDKEMVELIFQIIGAIVRPNVNWGVSAWFYSTVGNNGKGCLCKLMREICGNETYTSIPLADFSKEFMLEPLVDSSAIIVDENDVGTYIDKAANLKAVITQDVIQMNRKFKIPIKFQFKGFMVQCLNEYPRIKDRSDSFYRRQLFVPFVKSFTGAERKYIKNDYLERKEVLEYVLCKVLNMNYYELKVPKACQLALDEYKEFNDPVRQFMNEFMECFVWDLVPYKFLYELYCEWYKRNFSNTIGQLSKVSFKTEFISHLGDYPEWTRPLDKDRKDAIIKPANRMDRPEPLIDEYNLIEWMNPMYRSSIDINKKCIPVLKTGYKGILRK